MSETVEIVDEPEQVKIPSSWRTMQTLSAAMELLSQNPDLVGDDVRLALESEAPDTITLLNAQVADIQRSRFNDQAAAKFAELCTRRAQESAARTKRKEALLVQVMQNLRIKNHHAPAGTVWWSDLAGKVLLTDETAIPDKYKTPQPVEYKIDRKAIGRDLDNGIEVPGAMRGNGGVSLTIKG